MRETELALYRIAPRKKFSFSFETAVWGQILLSPVSRATLKTVEAIKG